jgi:hypothetical protein
VPPAAMLVQDDAQEVLAFEVNFGGPVRKAGVPLTTGRGDGAPCAPTLSDSAATAGRLRVCRSGSAWMCPADQTAGQEGRV